MKAIGTVNITNELTLTDPELSIKNVSYDWENHKVHIELIFKEAEASYKHSRTFAYDITPTGEMTTEDIYNLINNDPVLSVFK